MIVNNNKHLLYNMNRKKLSNKLKIDDNRLS